MPRRAYYTICVPELLEKFKEYEQKLLHFDPAPHLHFRKARVRVIGWLVLYGCLKPSEVATVNFAEITANYVKIQFTRKNRTETMTLDIAPVYSVMLNWVKVIRIPYRKPRFDIARVS